MTTKPPFHSPTEYVVNVFVPLTVEEGCAAVGMEDVVMRVTLLSKVLRTIMASLDPSSTVNFMETLKFVKHTALVGDLDSRLPFTAVAFPGLEEDRTLFLKHKASLLRFEDASHCESYTKASAGRGGELTEKRIQVLLGCARDEFVERRYYSSASERQDALRLYYRYIEKGCA